MTLSRAAIDRIGDRFRIDGRDPSAQAELLLYCERVRVATSSAREIVANCTTSTVTSRDGKSFRSIFDKLNRQSVRLSQIQDLEGCRCVVDTIVEQDALCHRLIPQFERVKVDDRRKRPTNGYRAVHLIPTIGGERYEIQIRTRLQHLWAQAVEVIADRLDDISFKYGGGDADAQSIVQDMSSQSLAIEISERALFEIASIDEFEEDVVSSVDATDEAKASAGYEAFGEFMTISLRVRDQLKKIPERSNILDSFRNGLVEIWDSDGFSTFEATPKKVDEMRTSFAQVLLELIGGFSKGPDS